MDISNSYITKSYKIKNLVCDSTVFLLKEKLEQSGYIIYNIGLGTLTLAYKDSDRSEINLTEILQKYGLSIIKDQEKQLVEDIKIAVIELVHQMNNVNSIVRRSDYLVEKLGKSYQQLSKIFSSHEPTTLEKFIILQKIERIKELISRDEYTLSEVAYMMEYSSVQYLSNQFRKITGMSVSDYKKHNHTQRSSLSSLS